MTNRKSLKALKETNKHIGQWYPVYRLALHLVNVAHFLHWSNYLVCSEYVAKVLYKAGARHSHFFGTTPDVLADEIECKLNKERTGPKYSIVFKGKLPFNYYYYCMNCKTYWLIPSNQCYCPVCINSLLDSFPVSTNQKLNKKIEQYNMLRTKYVASKEIKLTWNSIIKERNMWCDKFKCTLSTDACIRRQSNPFRGKTYKKYEDSFQACQQCEQGKLVIKHPDHFINRDFKALKTRHLRTLENRGFIFKESNKNKDNIIENYNPLKNRRIKNYAIRKIDIRNRNY